MSARSAAMGQRKVGAERVQRGEERKNKGGEGAKSRAECRDSVEQRRTKGKGPYIAQRWAWGEGGQGLAEAAESGHQE